MRFCSWLWGILISVSEREGLKHKETPTFKADFPGTSGICIRIHALWALITIPGIKAICFIKGKGGFRKIFKTFLYFSPSPFPPLFCERFAVVLCEFIGFIIWVTEATVSVRENWLLFPNVMYLIFFQQRLAFSSSSWLLRHSEVGPTIRMWETLTHQFGFWYLFQGTLKINPEVDYGRREMDGSERGLNKKQKWGSWMFSMTH